MLKEKNKSLKIFCLMFVVLFLTGCGKKILPVVQNQPTEPVKPVISEETKKTITDIYKSFDIQRCNTLDSELAISICKDLIEDTNVQGPVSAEELALYQKAIQENSTELCSNLKTTGLAKYCVLQIPIMIETQLYQEIMKSGDATRCNELKLYIDLCQRYFFPEQRPEL